MALGILVSISAAWAQSPIPHTCFKPGGEWLDTNAVHLDNHGGNLLYADSPKTCHRYGVHRAQPRAASRYSLKGLCNWKNGRVALEKLSEPKGVQGSEVPERGFILAAIAVHRPGWGRR